MSLFVSTIKRPSAVLAAVEGLFREMGQNLMFTASHGEFQMWSVSSNNDLDSPFNLEETFPVYEETAGCFCISGHADKQDSILVLMTTH